jgi:hypothetical protein
MQAEIRAGHSHLPDQLNIERLKVITNLKEIVKSSPLDVNELYDNVMKTVPEEVKEVVFFNEFSY